MPSACWARRGDERYGLDGAEGVAAAEVVDVPVAEASSISLRRRSSSRSNLRLSPDQHFVGGVSRVGVYSLASKDLDVEARPVPGGDGEDDDEERGAGRQAVDEQCGGRDHEDDAVDYEA